MTSRDLRPCVRLCITSETGSIRKAWAQGAPKRHEGRALARHALAPASPSAWVGEVHVGLLHISHLLVCWPCAVL